MQIQINYEVEKNGEYKKITKKIAEKLMNSGVYLCENDVLNLSWKFLKQNEAFTYSFRRMNKKEYCRTRRDCVGCKFISEC
jgi:hypothetical protein